MACACWRIRTQPGSISQDGTEIASGYALSRRPDHVRRDGTVPVIVPEVEGRTRRLSAAPAEKEADAAAHPTLTEVHVRKPMEAQ